MTAAGRPPWLHLLPPGEPYSPRSGGSLGVVAGELVREQARQGGRSVVVAQDGLDHDPAGAQLRRYPAGPQALGERERREDDAAARRGEPRPHYRRLLRPALAAVPPAFRGPVVLHNAVPAVPELRALRPAAHVVLYLHADMFRSFPPAERARVLAAADTIVAVSRFVADRFLDGTGHPPDAVRVVLNGHDPERFPVPAAGTAPGAPPVVAYVGRVAAEKGVLLLVDAARRLRAEGLPFRLRLVGNAGLEPGERADRYERQVERRAAALDGTLERVPFVARDAIGSAYGGADVLCVPSLCEDACPLVLVEGMASGLACLVTARGGVPELGGDAVRYFDPTRRGDLAGQLGRLLRDRPLRTELAGRARARAAGLTWATRHRELWAALAGSR